MPKIFVVRHGETATNAADKLRGWSDPPLNQTGKDQALKAGQALAALPDAPTHVVTSDLGRAQDTANAVASALKAPAPTVNPGFRPWNVGDLTGTDVKTAIPVLNAHIESPDTPLPGGESFNDFKTRFLSALADLVAKTGPSSPVALVTHNRGERLIDAFLKDRTDPSTIDTPTMMQSGIPPGSFVKYEV